METVLRLTVGERVQFKDLKGIPLSTHPVYVLDDAEKWCTENPYV